MLRRKIKEYSNDKFLFKKLLVIFKKLLKRKIITNTIKRRVQKERGKISSNSTISVTDIKAQENMRLVVRENIRGVNEGAEGV